VEGEDALGRREDEAFGDEAHFRYGQSTPVPPPQTS
jgi:hypothetical protein